MLQQSESPWYADFANYLVSGLLPPEPKFQEKKKFLHNVRSYQWDDPHLYKLCLDQVIRRCAAEGEILHIFEACHLQHMEDILVVTEQLLKYCNQVITGQLFLNMLMSLLNVVTGAKEQRTYLKNMKCH